MSYLSGNIPPLRLEFAWLWMLWINVSRTALSDTNADVCRVHAEGVEKLDMIRRQRLLSGNGSPVLPYGRLSLSIAKPHWGAVAKRLFKYCVCKFIV